MSSEPDWPFLVILILTFTQLTHFCGLGLGGEESGIREAELLNELSCCFEHFNFRGGLGRVMMWEKLREEVKGLIEPVTASSFPFLTFGTIF
jgi:hypothetical protein